MRLCVCSLDVVRNLVQHGHVPQSDTSLHNFWISAAQDLKSNASCSNEVHHVALFVLGVQLLSRPKSQVLHNLSHLCHKTLRTRPEDLALFHAVRHVLGTSIPHWEAKGIQDFAPCQYSLRGSVRKHVILHQLVIQSLLHRGLLQEQTIAGLGGSNCNVRLWTLQAHKVMQSDVAACPDTSDFDAHDCQLQLATEHKEHRVVFYALTRGVQQGAWSVVHRPRFFEHVRQQGGWQLVEDRQYSKIWTSSLLSPGFIRNDDLAGFWIGHHGVLHGVSVQHQDQDVGHCHGIMAEGGCVPKDVVLVAPFPTMKFHKKERLGLFTPDSASQDHHHCSGIIASEGNHVSSTEEANVGILVQTS
mmetsp:Transcript_49399/g.107646  ORF Transcript_49399/g.107646 Transcript_49399/m.107646 type:complete len:358 (-) Transcript_49399:2449-3522(-)